MNEGKCRENAACSVIQICEFQEARNTNSITSGNLIIHSLWRCNKETVTTGKEKVTEHC